MATSLSERPGVTIGFLLGSCCVAVVYNVVLFQAVRTLSSVGTAILGNVKIVMVRLAALWPRHLPSRLAHDSGGARRPTVGHTPPGCHLRPTTHIQPRSWCACAFAAASLSLFIPAWRAWWLVGQSVLGLLAHVCGCWCIFVHQSNCGRQASSARRCSREGPGQLMRKPCGLAGRATRCSSPSRCAQQSGAGLQLHGGATTSAHGRDARRDQDSRAEGCAARPQRSQSQTVKGVGAADLRAADCRASDVVR